MGNSALLSSCSFLALVGGLILGKSQPAEPSFPFGALLSVKIAQFRGGKEFCRQEEISDGRRGFMLK